ncbi:hypothetical protein VDGD_21460 [Verticillium dahliae]|nr:hypothetical protein VDGD_21460 [Verticillium dahliae]
MDNPHLLVPPPPDPFHHGKFPYHPGRRLMITKHTPPEPFHGPLYHGDAASRSNFDEKAAANQHKTRSELVIEQLPRGTVWPTNDGTKSSQYVGLTIEEVSSTTKEFGSQVVLCKLNRGQKTTGIPPRVVAKIDDSLYYRSLPNINERFKGWIPQDYFEDEQRLADWLEDNFGGATAKNYSRQAELDDIEVPSYFNGRATSSIRDLVGHVGF